MARDSRLPGLWVGEGRMTMSRVSMILGLSAFLLACLSSQASAQGTNGYTTISAADLKKMQETAKDLLVIDTLANSRYKEGHIPGAKNFEFPNGNMDPWDTSKTGGKSSDDFLALLGGDKDRPVVFYCLDDQ